MTVMIKHLLLLWGNQEVSDRGQRSAPAQEHLHVSDTDV